MSTVIRAEISEKNQYYISKHRYYELKHFCLQYNEWKQEYEMLEPKITSSWEEKVDVQRMSDSTADLAIRRLYLYKSISLIEKAAKDTTLDLAPYLLESVTNGYSYETMLARRNVPCCREVWYGMYRKFFYILDRTRK